jgi:hypothetical protein
VQQSLNGVVHFLDSEGFIFDFKCRPHDNARRAAGQTASGKVRPQQSQGRKT